MAKKKSRLAGQSKRPNILSGQAAAPQKVPEGFCVSLKHFDSSQGQKFKEWEEAGFLAKLLDRWHAHSSRTLEACLLDKGFHRYGAFPAKSEFRCPNVVPPDAIWASMHIQSKQCVAGHVIGNVFYVVFLDWDHKFWPVDKKNT
jgi:hypothetical protein